MAYVVKVTRRAERDLDHLFQDIRAAHIEAALDWYKGLKQAILSLENKPQRCRLMRRAHGIRQLLYGRKPHVYLVICRVLQKQKCVEVLHVRHGARRRFLPKGIL